MIPAFKISTGSVIWTLKCILHSDSKIQLINDDCTQSIKTSVNYEFGVGTLSNLGHRNNKLHDQFLFSLSYRFRWVKNICIFFKFRYMHVCMMQQTHVIYCLSSCVTRMLGWSYFYVLRLRQCFINGELLKFLNYFSRIFVFFIMAAGVYEIPLITDSLLTAILEVYLYHIYFDLKL